MGDENHNGGGGSEVVEIYPLSRYYFGAKEASQERDETLEERLQRLKSNYTAHGMRTCVLGVLVVELLGQPHVLILQVRNSNFKLPGGRVRPGESDIDGLKRKLSNQLSFGESDLSADWNIGGCIGMWWRSGFDTIPCPYIPPNVRRPKECIRVFLVRLPMSRRFAVPKNKKLLAVPLCQLHENNKTYGPIISGIPHLLSKFFFNVIED